MGGEQHVGAGEAFRRVEFPARELDKEPERILEIDSVEDHPVAHPGIGDAARAKPVDNLHEHGARDVEGDVMDAAGVGRRAALDRLAVLAGEYCDEPAVAGIKIDMALAGIVEVRLLENERHAEQALPEVDRGLPIGADQGNVMQTLGLKLLHFVLPQAFSTSLDLYSLRGRAPA